MQDITRRAVEPFDLVALAIARLDAETGRHIPVKGDDPLPGPLQNIQIMEERQIMQQDIIGRKTDVMGQARARQFDVLLVNHPSVTVGDAIKHIRRLIPVIEINKFILFRIDLGMGRQGAL